MSDLEKKNGDNCVMEKTAIKCIPTCEKAYDHEPKGCKKEEAEKWRCEVCDPDLTINFMSS
nr:hypothetical protein [uncultured Dethiosulfovibrio sp.]